MSAIKPLWAYSAARSTALVMAMEEEFEIGETQEEDLSGLKTVGDAVNYIAGKLNKAE